MTSHLNRLELGSRSDNLQYTLQLGRALERQEEGLHRDEGDVVVCSNHSRIQRRNAVVILIELNNLGVGQILQCFLD